MRHIQQSLRLNQEVNEDVLKKVRQTRKDERNME